MQNTIDIRIEFSFKGEDHTLSTTLDLDTLAPDDPAPPDFHHLLAQANGIDTYSYLYEALETYDVEFSNARGLAAACLHDGVFDMDAFRRRRQEQHELAVLGPVAQQYLQVTDLDNQPALKQALLAAYQAGKSARA